MTEEKKPTGFKYLVCYGGGEGPDVWDKEKVISAVDMQDAVKQAQGIAEESGGWVFHISQEDYPLSTRQDLEQKLLGTSLELDKVTRERDEAKKTIAEIGEFLWPNQTGLPNEHRDCLLAITTRERLALSRIAKLEKDKARLESALKDIGAFTNDRNMRAIVDKALGPILPEKGS